MSQIAFRVVYDAFSGFGKQIHVFFFCDVLKVFFHGLAFEAAEAEYSASALDGFDDFTGLVTDQDEAGGAAACLHDATECGLGGASHLVAFIQNDQCEGYVG